MGRTNPTYRDRLEEIEAEFEPYRRALRASEQPHVERLFEHGRTYAHAAGYLNHPNPEIPFLVSVLLAHERELAALTERVAQLEEVDDGADG
ncbi:hypothetical protein GRX03_04180 [Halovenus sp. WSH3]|uniref:DUF8156 domain-containing protein n=1 Tax=Halovenus carboxidivorans TaxID=2692199 RepID=A0A6B0SYX1_9EURY|nr:hypothetical protein [Halovenus carboxidivorans]MXR50804.1 hypothetical protein [Halovenus carboxidivorans]